MVNLHSNLLTITSSTVVQRCSYTMFGGSQPTPHRSSARPLASAALIDREQMMETQREQSSWGHRRSLPDTLNSRSQSLAGRSKSAPDYANARRGSLMTCLNEEQSYGAFGSSFLGRLFGMSDPSTVSHRSSRRSSLVQGERLHGLSSARPLASAALIDKEQMDYTHRTMAKRSLSLVSKLDSKQLTHSSNTEPEVTKPKDLLDLNTLEEALPVVRAAVRFRTAVEKKKYEKPEDTDTEEDEDLCYHQMPNKTKHGTREEYMRRRDRRPHKLY